METFNFNPKSFGYHASNAHSLSLVSQLAYVADTQQAEQLGKAWGFEKVCFFNQRGTQAILLADHEKIIVGFRGSETVLED